MSVCREAGLKSSFALLSLVLSAAALLPLAAQAQIYICKDARGKTHTSDRPIDECNNSSVREVSRSGVTRREIAAPLTEEQKRQARQEEDRLKAEKQALNEQRHNDRALRARFQSEQQIINARERTAVQAREQLRQSRTAYVEMESRRKPLQQQADNLLAQKKPLPHDLVHKLDEIDGQLDQQTRKIGMQENEVEQIESKYEAMIKRFRELEDGK